METGKKKMEKSFRNPLDSVHEWIYNEHIRQQQQTEGGNGMYDIDKNIIEELYGAVDINLPVPEVELGMRGTIECAMILAHLTDREEKIIRMRISGMSFDEVAKEFDVTRERIRQIEAKACRKLRHPSASRVLQLGLEDWIKERVNKRVDAILTKEREELLNEKAKLANEWKRLEEAKETNGFAKDTELPPTFGEMLEQPIQNLDLSVRSYNCLTRAGIYTIRDIIEKIDILPKIRNMGVKSVNEIHSKLEQMGVYPTEAA